METLLEKIQHLEFRFDQVEKAVQAFLPEPGRFDRLRREADRLLAHFPDPAARPALFGQLTGVKDIFRVDGFETRAGSQLPPDCFAGAESESVSQLKASGVLILGKTVTTEFAYFGPGATRNPHNLEHTPGGSSSGSAAAVAAGLSELALGTQTIGSVNRPAAFCGTCGFKASYNRISKRGVIPLSESLDHVGLFAPDVSQIEAAAAVLCRGWQAIRESTKRALAVPTGPYLDKADPEALQHLMEVADSLRSRGWEILETPALLDFDAVYDRHELIVAAEAARIHRSWFESYANRYHPKTRELILKGQAIPDSELLKARSELSAFRSDMERVMQEKKIVAWITPSATGPAPHGLDSTGNPVMNLPWTQAGLPSLTVPSGFSASGLPLGTQLVGRWYRDESLLALGRMIEAALK